MNSLVQFSPYFIVVLFAWLIGIILLVIHKPKIIQIFGHVFINTGFITLTVYLAFYWKEVQRFPFETSFEVRLWYSLLFAFTSYVLFIFREYIWLLVFSLILSNAVLFMNFYNPVSPDQTQLPIYLNQWFLYYKILNYVSFAILTYVATLGFKGIIDLIIKKPVDKLILLCDLLVKIGVFSLTISMISGAIWLKQTLGHYWNFTEFENWLIITWFIYIVYIHIRNFHPNKVYLPFIYLIIATVFPVICLFGNIQNILILF